MNACSRRYDCANIMDQVTGQPAVILNCSTDATYVGIYSQKPNSFNNLIMLWFFSGMKGMDVSHSHKNLIAGMKFVLRNRVPKWNEWQDSSGRVHSHQNFPILTDAPRSTNRRSGKHKAALIGRKAELQQQQQRNHNSKRDTTGHRTNCDKMK